MYTCKRLNKSCTRLHKILNRMWYKVCTYKFGSKEWEVMSRIYCKGVKKLTIIDDLRADEPYQTDAEFEKELESQVLTLIHTCPCPGERYVQCQQ